MPFENLSDVIFELPARAAECKVTCEDDVWNAMIGELCVEIPRGQTHRAAAKCNSYNGKPLSARAKRHFCVWVERREDGRYEYGCNT